MSEIKEIWVYTITFYVIDDEYGHRDLIDTWVEVFSSKESAERYKVDFEEIKNLEYISEHNLNGWFKINEYVSFIDKKEILTY